MTDDTSRPAGFVVEASRELDAPPAVAWLEMSRQGLEQSLDKLTPLFADGDVVL